MLAMLLFSGSVGKVNNNSGSGVLFAGNVRGNKKENATCEAEVTIDDICFENLKVTIVEQIMHRFC